MAIDDTIRGDASALELGRIARSLDGSVTPAEDAAGRERLLIALDSDRRPRLRWLLPSAAAGLLCLAIGVAIYAGKPERIEYRVTGSSLQIEDDWLGVAKDQGAAVLRFSEGTRIELGPGSKGRVAELTAQGAHVVLGSGALRARVVHRRHTRWLVGAGPYSIDVTGTSFDVDWSQPQPGSGRLEVRLHEGSVIVRGPALHEGIRVAAGQRLVAHAENGSAELSALAPRAPVEPPAPTPAAARPQASPARPAPSWSDLLTSGNFQGVLALAQARGIDATLRRGSLADLVALSDSARYAGDRALAEHGLLAQRARFPGSAEAHAAAFVLGRLADDQGSPDEALRWYDAYLGQSPRGAFAAEALGRKLVVLARAGDAAAARSVAKSYLARFPRGAHAAYARELLQRP